jgi:LacI family transcriptional regulator
VSIKTASRVVTGEAGVSPELSERVQAAVVSLGYVPNPLASSLRRKDHRTGTIAVLVDDLSNPFSATLHRAVVDAVRAEGFLTLSANTDDRAEIEQQAIQAFLTRNVDGLVVMPSQRARIWLEELTRAAFPVVLVDRPASRVAADLVRSDHRGGAETAARHLLTSGHRRIAFLGAARSVFSARARERGFVSVLTAAAIEPGPVCMELAGIADAMRLTGELLAGPRPPTALLTAQNLLTMGAIRALRRAGRQHDVALVGFDDVPAGDLLDPGVTVLAQDPSRIGAVAADQLLRRIAGEPGPARLSLVDVKLVTRGSGEIPPTARR